MPNRRQSATNDALEHSSRYNQGPAVEMSSAFHSEQPNAVPEHIAVIQNLKTEGADASVVSHFTTMMSKNAKVKRRTPVSTLLETLLPVVFVLGLIAIWAGVNEGKVSRTDYVKTANPTLVPDFNATMDAFACKSLNVNGTVDGLRDCTSAEMASPSLECYDKPPIAGLCTVYPGIVTVLSWLRLDQPRYIPTMDEMILMQWIANATVSAQSEDAAWGQPLSAIANGGYVHVVPENADTRALVAYLNASSKFFRYAFGRFFNDTEDALSYSTGRGYANLNWAVIQANQLNANGFDVVLHMNRSGIAQTNRATTVGNGLGDYATAGYFASGFLTLQDQLQRFYATQVLSINAPPRIVHSPMGFGAYDTSSFLTIIGSLSALFLVFGYLYPVSQLVKKIVEEKEQRVREAMMIMGLTPAPFYLSWVITYVIMQFVTALVCAILLKVTMFPKSDFFIMFLLYFLFGMSIISLSSALSSLFSKARVAALVAPVVFFLFSIPSFALPATTPAGLLILLSLMSPTGFAQGMRTLSNKEISGGLVWSNINTSFDGYPMSVVLVMLALDFFIYLLLTLYFDQVLPSEWGTRRSPCFCFNFCGFGRRGAQAEQADEESNGRDPHGVFEPDTPGLKPSVEIRGMRKEFVLPSGSRMTAVNDLNFNMYENQVYALLGHNGAGKTTAMNLMTGMLEMDRGDCRFHGHSVRDDLPAVRKEIGYCPQHNILWDDLTCREHLDFFARLKGIEAAVREVAVEAMLKAVDLEAKGDKFPSELSGGQKRKLSVGIAFIGGSKVVFLDEPTAGMDVAARRFTWELIKLMTKGRTIVLTTHFMDEADLLGHTIGIMAKGRLKCSGSSLFLKSRLGVGYTLAVSTQHGVNSNQQIIDTVQRYVPNLEVLSNGAGEVGLRLPMDSVNRFPALLSHLENNGQSMGVRGHGISVTTLEEIFLKLGHDDEEETAQSPNSTTSPASQGHSTVPVEEKPMLVWNDEVAAARPTHAGQFRALVAKRWHYSKRDTRTIVMQIVLPVVCITFAMLLTLVEFSNQPEVEFGDYSIYDGDSDYVFAGCPAGWSNSGPQQIRAVDAGALASGAALSNYLIDNEKKHVENRIGAHYCSDPSVVNAVPEFFTPLNQTQPVAWIFTNNSIYSFAGPQAFYDYQFTYNQFAAGRQLRYKLAYKPLPLSAYENAFVEAITSVFVAIFVLIPFTFIPSTFVSFVVKERECKALQLQRASGMNYIVYWCANFVFDMLSFVITAVLALIIFGIFSRDEYVGTAEVFFAVLVLMMFYGMAGVAGSYICSFFFNSHSTAQNIVMLVNFICGFMLVLLAYILQIIESTKTAGKVLRYFFRFVPSYCLGEGILNLANRQLGESFGQSKGAFSLDVIGWDLIYLGILFPIFFVLVLYLDSPLRREQAHRVIGEADVEDKPEDAHDEDDDVAIERQEVESGARNDDIVLVKGLRKFYPGNHGGTLAVKNLSFGVHKGEVFGFLGTNGAGKTTTISILCGDQMPTKGDGYIKGKHVVDEAAEARSLIGYCPQFDATHDLLTVEEHLELYARLHGLHGDLAQKVIEGLIATTGLQEHRGKESRSLSGGNRRKLSVAISLLGAPQVAFLDEPSAGMDPMARRQMWSVIEQIAVHCSVVLTTHHLEEIEALSSRMGIMVDGELKCIGPLQHLKTKFGSGFEMSMRLRTEEQVPEAIAFFSNNIDGAALQETRGAKLTFSLPQATRLSTVFETVQQHRNSLGITDYSISQTSLESVFLRISADALAREE